MEASAESGQQAGGAAVSPGVAKRRGERGRQRDVPKALLRHGRHLCGLVSQHGPKHAQPLTLARDLALQRLHAQQQPPSTSLHV